MLSGRTNHLYLIGGWRLNVATNHPCFCRKIGVCSLEEGEIWGITEQKRGYEGKEKNQNIIGNEKEKKENQCIKKGRIEEIVVEKEKGKGKVSGGVRKRKSARVITRK